MREVERSRFVAQSPRILVLVTNPQNQWVATTKDDGTLHLWDFSSPLVPGTAPPVWVLPAHQGMATTLAFSPSGRLLASSGSDRPIDIWDLDTRQLMRSLRGHTDTIDRLHFISDAILFSHGNDGISREWDISSGESTVLRDPRDRLCLEIATTADGRSLAWGTVSAMVILLDRSTDRSRELAAVGNRLRKLAFSRDDRYLIGVTDDGRMNCWDLTDNDRHSHWAVDRLQTTVILPHPHEPTQVFLALEDGSIALWDLHQQTCRQRINTLPVGQRRQHYQAISSIGILPHPDRLIICNVEGKVTLWEFHPTGLRSIYAIDFPRPYQGMKITDVRGLNQSQRLTLQQLGAEL